MPEEIPDRYIQLFMEKPHLFGHYLGYTLLSDIHTKWIKDCWMRNDNYALRAHRNSYKTTAILVVGAIWWLTFYNTNERILFLRKSWEESAAIGKEIKQQFESPPVQILYKEKFNINNISGNVWRDSALSLSTKNQITKEPNILCLGVGANLTGGHHTKIFGDDIITLKDRISQAERKKTIVFMKELSNIPTVDGNIIYTGTPWHKEDGWNNTPIPIDYPVGSIDIQGFTKEKLAQYKSELGASLYAANYELKHIADEDRLFPEPLFGEWPDKRFKRCCAWVDPAYEGEDSTALSIICIDMLGHAHAKGWIWFKHVVDVYANIVSYCKVNKVGTMYVETNSDKGASKKDLDKLWPAVIGRNESMNKHVKIVSYLKYNWMKIQFAYDCNPEYLNQILDYTEEADHDDAADSLAALIREMKIGGNSLLKRFGVEG
jgi:hypothetical protein